MDIYIYMDIWDNPIFCSFRIIDVYIYIYGDMTYIIMKLGYVNSIGI